MDLPTTPHPRTQRGAVAVAFILSVVLLLGFVAFSLDVGRLYVSKTELQNAADSCALSAATALTGANANQLTMAENYGIAAGARNRIGLQGVSVTIAADKDVTFSETLNGAYQTRTAAAANALKMHYARCTVSEPDVSPILFQVIRVLGQKVEASTINATAVASLGPSKSNCALPLAICKSDVAGKVPGTWIKGILSPGSAIDGAFKWIEFPGYERNKDLAGLLQGEGQCGLDSTTTVESHPGFDAGMMRSWNTRFGIYHPGGGLSASTAPPDLTGWVYDPATFPAQKDAMADFLSKRAQATPKHQTSPAYKLENPNKWATDEEFQSGQDRRLVVGPIVNCNDLASSAGKTAKVEGWACYLMLNPISKTDDTMYLEYRGSASDPSSGCVTNGAPGGLAAGGPNVPTLVQ